MGCEQSTNYRAGLYALLLGLGQRTEIYPMLRRHFLSESANAIMDFAAFALRCERQLELDYCSNKDLMGADHPDSYQPKSDQLGSDQLGADRPGVLRYGCYGSFLDPSDYSFDAQKPHLTFSVGAINVRKLKKLLLQDEVYWGSDQFNAAWLKHCLLRGVPHAWIYMVSSALKRPIPWWVKDPTYGKDRACDFTALVAVGPEDGLPMAITYNQGTFLDDGTLDDMLVLLESTGVRPAGIVYDRDLIEPGSFIDRNLADYIQEHQLIVIEHQGLLHPSDFAAALQAHGGSLVKRDELKGKCGATIGRMIAWGPDFYDDTPRWCGLYRQPDLNYQLNAELERKVKLELERLKNQIAQHDTTKLTPDAVWRWVQPQLRDFIEVVTADDGTLTVQRNEEVYAKAVARAGVTVLKTNHKFSAKKLWQRYAARLELQRFVLLAYMLCGPDTGSKFLNLLPGRLMVALVSAVLRHQVKAYCRELKLDYNYTLDGLAQVKVRASDASGAPSACSELTGDLARLLAQFGIKPEDFESLGVERGHLKEVDPVRVLPSPVPKRVPLKVKLPVD